MKQLHFDAPIKQNGRRNGTAVIRRYQKVSGGLPMRPLPDSD
jgi:hypothetical protein